MNPAFHDSLDLPPNSILPGTPVEDAVRAAAHRGVYGPGDPETQVAAVLAPDRSRPGRLRRRTFNGRTFDLNSAPLPDGGYVVCAVEITSLIAARADAERAQTQTTTALATLQLGLAAFGPAGALLFANPRFAELLALPPDHVRPGIVVPRLARPDGRARRVRRSRWCRISGRAAPGGSLPLLPRRAGSAATDR